MAKKDDFLLEDDLEPIKKEEQKESSLNRQKRIIKRKYKISIIVMTIISILLIGFGLVWQRRYDLWAFSNALWLAFAIEFFVAWIFFVYNKNILSPLIHGFKVFGLMLVGKRTKESYYDYTVRIEENPIPKYIYNTVFIFAFILLIPAVITMIKLL